MKPALFLFIVFIALSGFVSLDAQTNSNLVYVDDAGILRWSETDEEAAFFGVNYASPFAYSYRNLKKLGIDIKKVIDADVAHFARLDLNAFRIHVWDREVSDQEGNLIENEHLELLDYLIHKLKEKGIYTLLTPIAWWGTGWPEPDPPTEGISTYYSKVEMITDPEARMAQENYLKQFVNHFNKYENTTYKDDPYIIAFEIINEPHHPQDTSITADYIKQMVTVLRSEGVTKPIYYNISESWDEKNANVVSNSDIQGISFQWYPTGLVKRSEIEGNYLSHVDHYSIPKIDNNNFKNKTRMVYEFDAADVGDSYMYPAMARSFKEAGMQWATMFCYDPLPLAPYNSEYQTHFLNLLYTPQKAIGLMIAANLFRNVEAYRKFDSYPANLEFDGSKIDYESNLSEMLSGDKFYYTNNTSTIPADISSINHIAGFGSSSVVESNSRGAYFLDKISDAVWRLEVYPDAVWLKDPFGINTLGNKVADIYYDESEMKIHLPDLTDEFFVYPLKGDDSGISSSENKIVVKQGVYILSKEKIGNPLNLNFDYNNLGLTEFYIPKEEVKPTEVIVRQDLTLYSEQPLEIPVEIYSSEKIKGAQLFIRSIGWNFFSKTNLKKEGKHNYNASLPRMISNGIYEYCVAVITDKDTITYPAGKNGMPGRWDFDPGKLWKVKVIPTGNPVTLFDPAEDYENVITPNIWDKVEFFVNNVYDENNDIRLEIRINKIKQPIDELTFQIELDDKIKDFNTVNDGEYKKFSVNVFSENKKLDTVIFRFITIDYYTGAVQLTGISKNGNKIIQLKDFKDDKFVLLPRPYPRFLPYFYEPDMSDISRDKPEEKLNFLQFTIPLNGIGPEEGNGLKIRIGKIELQNG